MLLKDQEGNNKKILQRRTSLVLELKWETARKCLKYVRNPRKPGVYRYDLKFIILYFYLDSLEVEYWLDIWVFYRLQPTTASFKILRFVGNCLSRMAVLLELNAVHQSYWIHLTDRIVLNWPSLPMNITLYLQQILQKYRLCTFFDHDCSQRSL